MEERKEEEGRRRVKEKEGGQGLKGIEVRERRR